MRNKLKTEFPKEIYYVQKLIPICMGLFKSLYYKKYQLILDYMKKDCFEIIKKYKNYNVSLSGIIPRKIWVLWYDTEFIKPIPKVCISIMKKINGYETIFLTKDNLGEYIPSTDICELLNKKIISIQFFSDLVRARILKKYGGFWIDSTIAIVNPSFLDKIIQNYSFFSIYLEHLPSWCSVSMGKFSSYFWASVPENPFFYYLDECLTYFVMKHGMIIDYFQIDFTIMLGYMNIPFIKDEIDSILPSNPNIFWLSKRLNKKFNEKDWNMITRDTSIFKLSWRRELDITSSQFTYWNKIISLWNISKNGYEQ